MSRIHLKLFRIQFWEILQESTQDYSKRQQILLVCCSPLEIQLNIPEDTNVDSIDGGRGGGLIGTRAPILGANPAPRRRGDLPQ